ncbi:MAG: hypothetical protein P4L16_07090 [Chlamydiales bacterium]|nr:hypothetical protein [Chlamydiales bacterium]
MKKLATIFALVSLMTFSTQAFSQQNNRRPQAAYAGQQSGISGATIAAGIGVIVAIAAIALISNNSHSH